MAVTVTHVQAGGYPASVDRMGRAALLTKAGAANKVRTGILPFNGAELLPGPSTPTPDMHTVVTPGCAVIPDAAGGAYIFVSDSTVTLTHTASSGTNPRTDLIIARVYDNEAGDATATTPLVLPGTAGSVNVETITGAVEIVTGTAGVGAPVPLLPNSPAGSRCIVLAQVTVGTSVTSINAGNIATTAAIGRPGRTVAAGGILPVLTEAEIAGLTQYDGQLYYPADTDRLLRSKGGAAAVLADPAVFTPWSAYTVLWGTIAGGTCTVGTGGSISGWFKKIGFLVDWEVTVITGPDASIPSGSALHWSLPTVPNCRGGALKTQVGFGNFIGGTNVNAICYGESSTAAFFQAAFGGSGGNASSVVPASWLSRTVTFSGRYESTT